MYKHSATLAIGALIYAFAFPYGHADSVLELPLKPVPGSKALVEYTLTKNKNGETTRGTITGWIHLFEATDKGFEASWTTESVEADGVVFDKSHPKAASYLIDQPFKYLADVDGLPTRLLEEDDILNHMRDSGIIGEPDSDAMERVIAYFKGLSDEDLAQLFLKVPTLMSGCQATALEEGVPREGQEQIKNPFGEGSIMLYTRYLLASVDRDANLATIEFRSDINRDGVARMAQEFIKKLAPEKRDLAREFEDSDAELTTLIDCKVDMQTGWVQSLEASQVIGASGFYAVESFDVNLQWSD